jgi:hypothetical protein
MPATNTKVYAALKHDRQLLGGGRQGAGPKSSLQSQGTRRRVDPRRQGTQSHHWSVGMVWHQIEHTMPCLHHKRSSSPAGAVPARGHLSSRGRFLGQVMHRGSSERSVLGVSSLGTVTNLLLASSPGPHPLRFVFLGSLIL